jgi:hypothetical protein
MGLESFFGSNGQTEVSIHSTGHARWRDATERVSPPSLFSPEGHQVESNKSLLAMEYTSLSPGKFHLLVLLTVPTNVAKILPCDYCPNLKKGPGRRFLHTTRRSRDASSTPSVSTGPLSPNGTSCHSNIGRLRGHASPSAVTFDSFSDTARELLFGCARLRVR